MQVINDGQALLMPTGVATLSGAHTSKLSVRSLRGKGGEALWIGLGFVFSRAHNFQPATYKKIKSARELKMSSSRTVRLLESSSLHKCTFRGNFLVQH